MILNPPVHPVCCFNRSSSYQLTTETLVNNRSIEDMIQAAASGNVPLMKELLLAKGGNGVSSGYIVRDRRGNTPLHAAAAKGQLKAAQWIVATYGIGLVQEKNLNGETPLHLACSGVFSYLLVKDICESCSKADSSFVSNIWK